MKTKIKKILSLSALVFLVGFVGAFLGKSFEKTRLGQKLEKSLGIKTESKNVQTAQTGNCFEQQEKDNGTLFVGCNGFF
jgi:hypothetical protein